MGEMKPILLAAAIAGYTVAQGKAVEVSFQVVERHDPTVGVPAEIFRKFDQGTESHVGDTDDEGRMVRAESECSAKVEYRASPKQKIRHSIQPNWKSCTTGSPIVFVAHSSGVSETAVAFLNGMVPSEWVVPAEYEEIFVEIRTASEKEQWGVVAKAGSQIAAKYTELGRPFEADVFKEIALVATGSYAVQVSDDAAPGDFTVVSDKNAPSSVLLSEPAKEAIRKLQSNCGVPVDGVVGWRTMGCLPGGSGYRLPKNALVPLSELMETE